MDLKQLEYIIAIAEENNITHAAKKLFITQSALNQQLLKLEKELGTPLFVRSRTDWRPTEAGQVYIDAARQMLILKKDTYNKISDITGTLNSSLSIGFTPNRGIAMFSAIYPEFHTNHPDIHVEPMELGVHTQQDMIASGELDLGFMTLTDVQKQSDQEYIPITTEELYLALPAELSLKYEKYIKKAAPSPCCASIHKMLDLAVLNDEKFVLMNKNSTARELSDALFKQVGLTPDVLFETSSTHTIIKMIKSNICCGIIPGYYFEKTTQHDIDYYRLPTFPTWNIAASYKKNRYLSESAREFIDLAVTYYKKQ